MRYVHPTLYAELSQYYGLAPADWFAGVGEL
jgi:hypothetical protein